MSYMIAALLVLASAAPPAAAPAKPTVSAGKGGDQVKAGAKADDFDMAKMMAVFDKMFPAEPDPDPARLALARTSAAGAFPDGAYVGMLDEMMSGIADRVLGMSAADLPIADQKGKPADRATLREKAVRADPHFDERMRITRRVVGEEMAKFARIIEPRMREGLARSMARRFDEAQLRDINAFFATSSGRAYGAQSMRMWMSADVMRAMLTSFPEMFTAMPAAMKRIETETAHLPKPKKAAPAQPASDSPDED